MATGVSANAPRFLTRRVTSTNVIPPAATSSQKVAIPTIAARIKVLEDELRGLRAQQRTDLVAAIAQVIGNGVLFSARELFDHAAINQDLAAALVDAGIHNARVLGKRLRQMSGSGLDRVGADHDGAIWAVR
jgi:hypothetical protein